ncbi:LPS export ABC transporter periplasmic protein LptC [Cognatishimia sp. WU-CL00825]|uniref:LPS export ABC transporter periplasmic protein LptC n=1 Tax=Cognatishimia sp. WU-CL00825 TaxID=3127658 RepID=UPI003365A332
MARRGLTYSTVIAWLKVLLPLIALMLLSTMFLFARSVAPTSSIPFAKSELEERARDQRISAPFFAGQTLAGDSISVTAESAKPDLDNPRVTHASDISAQLDFTDGSTVAFASDAATINSLTLGATLKGHVMIESTTGYTITTQELLVDMDTGTASATHEIAGSGPAGQFRAGAMQMSQSDDGARTRFLFTNGVNLLYTPQ